MKISMQKSVENKYICNNIIWKK